MVSIILVETREGFLEASRLDIKGGKENGHLRVEEGKGTSRRRVQEEQRHRGREIQVHGGPVEEECSGFPPQCSLAAGARQLKRTGGGTGSEWRGPAAQVTQIATGRQNWVMGINLRHTTGSPPPTIWAGGAWLGGRRFVLTLGCSTGFSDLTRSSGALDPLPPASNWGFPVWANGTSMLQDPQAANPRDSLGCCLSISGSCGLGPQNRSKV